MRRWFLSYNTQDLALMQALEAGLRQKDAGAHIFFAPKSLRAGDYWLPELAKEIAESTAFVLLVSERGVGHWQNIEYYEAFGRRVKEPNYPVILLLKEGQSAPGLPFLHQLHRVVTSDLASEDTLGKLMRAADGAAVKPGELWRYTRPYRGLEAMTECDNEFFFGRGRETVEVIKALAAERGKLPILLGNSGVGKSSVAQAGVVASLVRQAWPRHVTNAGQWPTAFDRSRQWCFLTLRPGTDPLKALVEAFLDRWGFEAESKRIEEQNALIALLRDRQATLSDLLDATERRYQKLAQPAPPAFFLYIDQGEELYVRTADKQERRRFSEIVAGGLAEPRHRLRALMSLRADFFGELQKDELLFAVHRLINVAPLREDALNNIVSNPAEVLGARFETDTLAADIARRTAEEAVEDAGALPLLSYLLDDMWSEMVRRGDGVLRLPMQAIDLGRVLVERANKFVAGHQGSEAALRRIFTLKLATVRPDGEPMRRRALRSEFSDEEWWLVSELADHPNRLLVTATPEVGETYGEVAHEAIFRRWDKLREWIASKRDFLLWRTSLEIARKNWQATPDKEKSSALLVGHALAQARFWLADHLDDISLADRQFIELSREAVRRGVLRRRALRASAFGFVALVGWWFWLANWLADPLWHSLYWLRYVNVLTNEQERALRPNDTFKECADCPEMIVVPGNSFLMGSAEGYGNPNEHPQHQVTIAKPFAVSRFEISNNEWRPCSDHLAGLFPNVGWRCRNEDVYWWGTVQNVSWRNAEQYVNWLSTITGKEYRLLSEAEWEYAARSGFLKDSANPLEEQAGSSTYSLWEWVADCYHDDYVGAPPDGEVWIDQKKYYERWI
jgi:formylglycine-generating enzyme required for sulfatase activity